MVTVKVSDQTDLQIPRHLSRELSLADGDQVELIRRGDLVILQKVSEPQPTRSLRSLAGLVKSSRPSGSIHVAPYLAKKGYGDLRA